MSKTIIRLDLARRDSEETSVIEQMYEEREALLRELRDMKRILAMVLSVNGPTQLPNGLLIAFDFEHTDIVEEKVEAGYRYSIDQWAAAKPQNPDQGEPNA